MRRTLIASCTLLGLLSSLAILPAPAQADGGVTFTDVAAGDGAGITYRNTPPPRNAIKNDILALAAVFPIPVAAFTSLVRPSSPQKATGAPGVAILDFDRDGDLDIYAANGPGTPNSLYSSQLVESGQLTFVDVAIAAGVDATDQESSGVCYGDIDNDGDPDLYVVGVAEPNRLFENNGDGTFTDITAAANAAGQSRHGSACSFGDVNNDGLLDVVVANTYSGCHGPINPFIGQPYPCAWRGSPTGTPQSGWQHRHPVFGPFPVYPGMEHNTLLVNLGGNQFVDDSAASGIENVSGMAGPGLSGGAFTWAIAMWDYDLDGSIDIHSADNQGTATQPIGPNRIFRNDGTGNFSDVTSSVGLAGDTGGWMGIAPADFNCDGRMDFFASDFGSYLGGSGAPSRWFLQQADGTFHDPGVGALLRTPFGWGNSAFDYDNDGDSDIIYHGSVDIVNLILADNPGVLLQNQGDCTAVFTWDQAASSATDHRTRTVEGVATGDLNGDGFEDVVSVSGFDFEPSASFLPAAQLAGGGVGSPFDSVSGMQIVLSFATDPGFVVPVPEQPTLKDGTLSVEINSGGNGNGSLQVRLVGSAGILSGGSVNRDGIGASVSVTPAGGKTSTYQVLGGSSYASQHSLAVTAGLGTAAGGTVEVLWPGGVRNRLYGVAPGERVTFPHIPCSFDGNWRNFGQYNACVMQALNAYKGAGILSAAQKNRLRASAVQAFADAQ